MASIPFLLIAEKNSLAQKDLENRMVVLLVWKGTAYPHTSRRHNNLRFGEHGSENTPHKCKTIDKKWSAS
jgi:hypothetical protein